AGSSGRRCCAGRSCSTTRALTSRRGCAGSASCSPPVTTRAFTSRPPRAWSRGPCRCSGTGPVPRRSTTCAGFTVARPRWPPRSWPSTTTTGGRQATTRTPRRPPRSTWPACARPGMACSPRTWTPPCPGRYSSCSARLDAHVLHARRLGGHARGVRRADRGGRARRPAGHADPRAGARSLACSRRMRSRAALGRRAQPRRIARRDVACRDDLGRGRCRARPHGPGPRRPCLPGRGRRRRRGQRPGLLGGRGVRALGGDRELRLIDGRLGDARTAVMRAGAGDEGLAGAEAVARALTEAVRPLGGTDPPAELSLTGGKDSRLVAAALAAAQVPFRSRTHGFAGHPDVVVAGLIAAKLGVEHTVTRPRPPGAPDEADVLGRLRAAVLVSDGMLSAFENLGQPDPQAAGGPAETGGHGGELLRGGYAQ